MSALLNLGTFVLGGNAAAIGVVTSGAAIPAVA